MPREGQAAWTLTCRGTGLRPARLALQPDGQYLWAAGEGASDTSLAAFRIVAEMGSTEAVKQGVRAGVGVALISKRAVEDECRAGLVSCVKVTTMPVARAFYLVTNRERRRSPLALAFLTFLESQFPAAAS